MIRIVSGSISHETNSFSNIPTTLESFQDRELFWKEEVFHYFKGTRTIEGAFIDAARSYGFELIFTLFAESFAGGPVTREAYNILKNNLIDGILSAGKVNGVLLRLHGAMTVEDLDDAEGDILSAVRQVAGEQTPIVSTLDQHALLTEQMMRSADILVGYDTNPHVDFYERGLEAADLMYKLINHTINPVMIMKKPRLLSPLQPMVTVEETPMKHLLSMAHEFEKQKGVICVSVFGGYPYTDVADGGMSVLAVTDNDKELAHHITDELSRCAWKMRDQWVVHLTPVEEAVSTALAEKEGPVILADVSDSGAAGGAAGDGTVLLQRLVEAGAKKTAVCSIADPDAVAHCIQAGVGNRVEIVVGAKRDRLHGDPVKISGRVRLIHHGNFIRKGPMKPGTMQRMGRTVIVELGGHDGIELMLTELRTHPADPAYFTAFGIEPSERNILVVKSATMFRAAFASIAKRIIEVDTPGITSPNLALFSFKKLRRPMFPLDDIKDQTDE